MDFLAVHETATMLKRNPKTVRRYIQTGRLPAVKVGRRVRITRAAVAALAEPMPSTGEPSEPGIRPWRLPRIEGAAAPWVKWIGDYPP